MRICVLRVCLVSIESRRLQHYLRTQDCWVHQGFSPWKVTGLVSTLVWGTNTAHSVVFAFLDPRHLSLPSAGDPPLSQGETPGQLSSWAFSVWFMGTFQMAEVAKSLTSG